MATAMEISGQLQRLLGSYPAVKTGNPEMTAREFISQLEEFSPAVLALAVSEHIRSCKWFPTIAELIQLCRKFDNENSWTNVDWMAARLVELEDAWYQDGVCEEGDWMQLIEYFEKSERTCGAEQARRKFENVKKMLMIEVMA
jgi:hypothetical protein